MAFNRKAVCGGFLVGDGLEYDGHTLSTDGTGGFTPKIYLATFDYGTGKLTISDCVEDINSLVAIGNITILLFSEAKCLRIDSYNTTTKVITCVYNGANVEGVASGNNLVFNT